jgi:hypothetical protein
MAGYVSPSEAAALLHDPRVDLFDSTGKLLVGNDDWDSAAEGDAIAAAAAATGAFGLPRGSKDAALLLTLPPGLYSVHCSGVAAATGVAIIEVYEVR